jgi:hypothetical protein
MTATRKILVGLVLGLVTGLFLGDRAALFRVLAEVLDAGRVDLVTSGVPLTTRRASETEFSPPYPDETLALLVLDHRRAVLPDAAHVLSRQGATLDARGRQPRWSILRNVLRWDR